jgi:hypothetical protein
VSNRKTVSRRQFLESSATSMAAVSLGSSAIGLPHVASAQSTDIIAGAFRWDAWSKQTDVSVFAQRALSSPKFYKRAPFYCSVGSADEISCVGNAAEMDAEINAAARAGLKYWAFDWYAPTSSLRVAWDLYQQSPVKNMINWCGAVTIANLGSVPFSNHKWQDNLKEWAGYMQQRNYQKVNVGAPNRPLLYLFWDENQLKYYFENDIANVREAIDYLTQLLVNAGLHAPYIAVLHGAAGAATARALGGAISNYISALKPEASAPFIDLDRQAKEYWKSMADTGLETIPIAMVGWDTRARQERPGPWGPGGSTPAPIVNSTQYYTLATPAEFAAHVQSAVDFIHSHPRACPSKVLVIYSWDECDEGGALIPTIGDPNGAYLSAIAPIIT